jgi:hypothetical protein
VSSSLRTSSALLSGKALLTAEITSSLLKDMVIADVAQRNRRDSRVVRKAKAGRHSLGYLQDTVINRDRNHARDAQACAGEQIPELLLGALPASISQDQHD